MYPRHVTLPEFFSLVIFVCWVVVAAQRVPAPPVLPRGVRRPSAQPRGGHSARVHQERPLRHTHRSGGLQRKQD